MPVAHFHADLYPNDILKYLIIGFLMKTITKLLVQLEVTKLQVRNQKLRSEVAGITNIFSLELIDHKILGLKNLEFEKFEG